MTEPRITLRPATMNDWDTIRAWLSDPSIEDWWGPASATQAEVRMAMLSSLALCRMIDIDGKAVGYAHAIDATLWGADLPEELAPGTWDLDLFIAAEAYRGKGIGQRALSALKDEVFQTTLAVAVCVFPSVKNERAVRAYEKAGFKWQRIWNEPSTGPSWFMIAERPGRNAR